ncbi:MAG: hypothetical protein IPH93_17065 [Saprospiraceae bacterium]|nr:hypothetical protein [Saprospiraceae bacterium]
MKLLTLLTIFSLFVLFNIYIRVKTMGYYKELVGKESSLILARCFQNRDGKLKYCPNFLKILRS